MSMADRLRLLPPMPEDPGDAPAVLEALGARNALLCDTLANFCEAWKMLRGEYPEAVAEVIKACRIREAA